MTTLALLFALLLGPARGVPQPAAERFDHTVRARFFAGFAGDDAQLQQAMDICERTLAENPKHAEALVWHGSGLVFRAKLAFRAGDRERGGLLWERGLKEMDDAVAMQPDNVGVIVPRSAVLLQATWNLPEQLAHPLLQSAVAGYEHVLALQASYFATLGDHPRGELLFGLADGFVRLGQPDKARIYFERLVKNVPGSGQAPRADAWLKTGQVPALTGLGCVGCHK